MALNSSIIARTQITIVIFIERITITKLEIETNRNPYCGYFPVFSPGFSH